MPNKNKEYLEIIIDLNAVILSIDLEDNMRLKVLTIKGSANTLPWGLYNPNHHKTMERGLRHWVKQQTDMTLMSVVQLYTFADSGRFSYGDPNRHIVSVGYLACVKPNISQSQPNEQWSDIYSYFPWEDFSHGRPAILSDYILPELFKWSDGEETDQRILACFGNDGDVWEDENVLTRYEIMYEAGLVFEAVRDASKDMTGDIEISTEDTKLPTGTYMQYDHRRILATALGRIRAKVKYKSVIFDLMPDAFTLFELQKAAESVFGHKIHKQNFRRFVEREKLVVKTGQIRNQPSGRPAQIYAFNSELIGKPNVPGLKIGNSNSAH